MCILIGSFPVHASRSVGKVFGGEQLFITGPDFQSKDVIQCKFGDVSTTCYFINRDRCLCVAPEQYNVGLMELQIIIMRGSAVLKGATKYRYSEKQFINVHKVMLILVLPFMSDTDEDVLIETSDAATLIAGESATVTWNPHDLTESMVDTSVDIAMVGKGNS